MSAADRERILVVKLADLGDAILATPALARLRRSLPETEIEVLTTATGAAAFRHTGNLVDAVLTFDKAAFDRPLAALLRPLAPLRLGRRLRRRRYAAVLLLHNLATRYGALKHAGLVLSSGAPVRVGPARAESRRAWFLSHRSPDPGFDRMHVVETHWQAAGLLLEALGRGAAEGPGQGAAAPAIDRPVFLPGPEAEARAQGLLDAAPAGGPWVAIHPGSGAFSPARRWRPEGFLAVAEALARAGARIVLVGTESDREPALDGGAERGGWLDLIGRTDLGTLAAVLGRARLLVANDSGVGHLAAAMGTPVVAVFGPSNPVAWGPWWPGFNAEGRPAPSPHRVVALDLPCRPCFYVGHRVGSPAGCPSRDCLAWLPPERVIAVALELLADAI